MDANSMDRLVSFESPTGLAVGAARRQRGNLIAVFLQVAREIERMLRRRGNIGVEKLVEDEHRLAARRLDRAHDLLHGGLG